MTVDRWFIHRARIERNVEPSVDPYGHPLPPVWVEHIAALPCLFYQRSVPGETTAGGKAAVVVLPEMLVPRDADITEADRVGRVVDRRGQVINSNVIHIKALLRKGTYQRLLLEVVR